MQSVQGASHVAHLLLTATTAAHRYVRRRARQGFAEAAGVSDASELQRLWEQGRQQLEVARRQSLVYDLYSRRHKHAMVRRRTAG